MPPITLHRTLTRNDWNGATSDQLRSRAYRQLGAESGQSGL